MQGISTDDLGKRVEETVYTAVGLSILGYQHLQVQRREWGKTLGDLVRQVAEQAAEPGSPR